MKVSRFELEAPAPMEGASQPRTEPEVRAEARAVSEEWEEPRPEDTEEPGYGHGV